jgi:hypothetical protein
MIVYRDILPPGFAHSKGFIAISRLPDSPIPQAGDCFADMSGRAAFAILRISDNAVIFDTKLPIVYEQRWWDAVHEQRNLGIIVGDLDICHTVLSMGLPLSTMSSNDVMVSRLRIAVKGFDDGVGTRPSTW